MRRFTVQTPGLPALRFPLGQELETLLGLMLLLGPPQEEGPVEGPPVTGYV